MNKRQAEPMLFEPAELTAVAVGRLSHSSAPERGAVFTRPEVVEFILDLAGYTSEKRLWALMVPVYDWVSNN